MSNADEKIKILFVCFGNTCRSPMAEAIFKDLVKKKGLDEIFFVDSAALSSWQLGSNINKYTEEILEKIGIHGFQHKARQISYVDFSNFNYIFGMDLLHIRELSNAAEALKSSVEILLLGNFNPNINDKIIRDPICGDISDFEKCYDQISICCENFLEEIILNKLCT